MVVLEVLVGGGGGEVDGMGHRGRKTRQGVGETTPPSKRNKRKQLALDEIDVASLSPKQKLLFNVRKACVIGESGQSCRGGGWVGSGSGSDGGCASGCWEWE